jgi:uncharacterized protein
MVLQLKIVEDWKNALKSRDPKKDALSMIITELKNQAIKENVAGEQGRTVSDEVAMVVLQKMAKQRKEAIEAFVAASRRDLAEKEQLELSVVESYLPKALSDDELRAIISGVIRDTKASSMKDLGMVMGASIKASAGRADGKRIQAIVQQLLA